MKIVFFGTSPFGLPALEAIFKSSHTLSAIVTTPDKPQGRQLKQQPSPVKTWALSRQIPVIEASKQNILSIQESLQKWGADVFIVISFGVILPPPVLEIPKLAALNVHSSLLPKYRGPAPIHWALLNGDQETGVTVMRMVPALDAGDILLQESLVVLPEDDEKALHDRLAGIGASAILDALQRIEQKKAHFVRQDENRATYARKITKDDGRIVWYEAAPVIHDRVRALSGWPGTFTFYKGKRILIRKTSVAALTQAGLHPGQVIAVSEKEGILIAAKTGALKIEELQLEGRKALPASLFLQGFTLQAGDILE